MFTVQDRGDYTLVSFDIGGVITPDALATLTPPAVDARKGVVLSGRGPVWFYAFLVHHYHPTAWVATYDPRLGGAVVVQSHSTSATIGSVVPLAEGGTSSPGKC